jgi:hypothetical protein
MHINRGLSWFLNPIIRWFSMDTRPIEYAEFPAIGSDACTWETELYDLYSNKKEAHLHMNDLHVIELVHYKSNLRLEHEFLVATVLDVSGKTRYLLLDRHSPDGNGNQATSGGSTPMQSSEAMDQISQR